MQQIKEYKCILFDLDGTLLDTLDDIKNSINKILILNNLEPKSREFVRNAVGNGYKVFIDRCVDTNDVHLKEKILKEYSDDYAHNCDILTKPYPGITELLSDLKSLNIDAVILSNKGDDAVKELNKKYFNGLISKAYGVGNGIMPKPDPGLVNKIIFDMNLSKNEVLYIGDSDVDVKTANNAFVDCISVSWGFRSKEFLLENGAKRIIDKPNELLELLR